MFGPIFAVVTMAAAAGAAIFGFVTARGFMRKRLRFVDAAQSPAAPFIAGAAAWLVAIPVVTFLPFVGGGTALLFGLSVGGGMLAGKQDIVRGRLNP